MYTRFFNKAVAKNMMKTISVFAVLALVLGGGTILPVRADDEATTETIVDTSSSRSLIEEATVGDASSTDIISGGDVLDALAKSVGTTEAKDAGKSGGKDMLVICHVPENEPQSGVTMSIEYSEWPAHQAHGDGQGPCPKMPGDGMGSIQICKIILDAQGNITDGAAGATFTIPGLTPTPTPSTGAADGAFTDVSFTTPILLNSDLVPGVGFNGGAFDAVCTPHQSLPVGNYYYGEEQGVPATGWEAPKYYDYFDPTFTSFSQFASFSGVLYDTDLNNDETRNIVSDGHLPVYWSGQERRVVVLNQMKGNVCTKDCDKIAHIIVKKVVVGGDKNPSDFNMTIVANNPSQSQVVGSSTGVDVTVSPSFYQVVENDSNTGGYTTTYSAECDGHIAEGETKNCIVTNTFEKGYGPYCGDGIIQADRGEQCDEESASCTAQCQFSNQCTNKAFARVVIPTDGIKDWGTGDMTSDTFMGGGMLTNKAPSGTWFMIYDGTNWITDPAITSYENVPGLVIERTVGKIRLLMHGSHPMGNNDDENDQGVDKEHINGQIEFFNTTALSQENESGQNKVEKPTTGNYFTGYNAGDDSFDLVAGASKFWLTVTTADDSYFTNLSAPKDQCGGGDTGGTGGDNGGTDGGTGGTSGDNGGTGGDNGGTGGTSGDTGGSGGEVCDPKEELVINGAFEKPLVVANNGEWEVYPTLAGWNVGGAGNNPLIELIRGYAGWLAQAGDQFAALDANGNGGIFISQSIPTIAGQNYKITFSHSAQPGIADATNGIKAEWDGATLGSFFDSGVSNTNTSWTTEEYIDYPATSSSTVLKFTDIGAPDGNGSFLDSVSVTCIPKEGGSTGGTGGDNGGTGGDTGGTGTSGDTGGSGTSGDTGGTTSGTGGDTGATGGTSGTTGGSTGGSGTSGDTGTSGTGGSGTGSTGGTSGSGGSTGGSGSGSGGGSTSGATAGGSSSGSGGSAGSGSTGGSTGGSGGVPLALGATTANPDGEVLGDALAQTGVPVTLPMAAALGIMVLTFAISRKEQFN